MAASRTDPRIRKTRASIRDAFVRMMQKKDYEAITVTDIAESAQINRKTFYAHYETKDQIFTQIVEEMFLDLFGTFMYEKKMPGKELDEQSLTRDVRAFFDKVESYRETLNTLIGGKTAYMAFDIADRVIYSCMNSIHVTVGDEEGLVPASLMVTRIKNFFFTGIDWWLDQNTLTSAEAAVIFSRLMCKSAANIFRYEQMHSTKKKTEFET